MSKPAIRWVIALKPEAAPIIKYFGLKPIRRNLPYPIYRDTVGIHWLTISGIGHTQSAKATTILKTESDAPPWSGWINIGIAGCGSNRYGTLYWVDKIASENSSFDEFPGIVLTTSLPRAELITVNRPSTDYSKETLVDMEGYSFFQTAAKFSCRELVILLKVVSDGPTSDIRDLTSEKISSLINQNISKISDVVELTKTLSKAECRRIEIPEAYHLIIQQWHFTTSQKIKLNTLVRRYMSAFPKENPSFNLSNQKDAKSVIEYLSTQIAQHEVEWSQL